MKIKSHLINFIQKFAVIIQFLLVELLLCVLIPVVHFFILRQRIGISDLNSILKFVLVFSSYKYILMGYLVLYFVFYNMLSNFKNRKLKGIEVSLVSTLIYLIVSLLFFLTFPDTRAFLYFNISIVYPNFFYYSIISGFISPLFIDVTIIIVKKIRLKF